MMRGLNISKVTQKDTGVDNLYNFKGGKFLTIWLGYPEEIRSSTSSNRDDIDSLIEEIEAKDDEINDLQDQLVEELLKIDRDFKLREKFEDIYKGKIKTIIDNTASTLLELTTKLKSLEQAVISERSGLEASSNSSAGTTDAGLNPARAGNNHVPQKQIQTLRIDTVTNVVTSNNRWVVEHHVPGRAGTANGLKSSVIQDLGKVPASFMFKGVLTSNSEDRYDLQKKVEILKWFFNQHKPLFFSSRLVNKLEATKVIIEELNFEEDSALPYMVEFNCTLREYNDTNVQTEASETETSFKAQIKQWTEFQILNAATKYRNKFISDGEEINSSELSQKIATAIILENEVLKPIY